MCECALKNTNLLIRPQIIDLQPEKIETNYQKKYKPHIHGRFSKV